jgi:LAO/AO transport system kinase
MEGVVTSPSSADSGRLQGLVDRVRERRPRAIGKAISLIENRRRPKRDLIRRIYRYTGSARVVGVTGPPGAGKSTLVDRLTREIRRSDETVGILAVDPTSPFSGGAILGDRVRMQGLSTDPGVFIRSMATRGAMGGLAPATHDAVDVLDAAGFDWILVETVGVGQDEVDIVRSVDTVVVVTVPGLGDDIQTIKAGIMEIADIFVINKADRDGVERTYRDLTSMVAMTEDAPRTPPIVRTVATGGEGVAEVLTEICEHSRWLKTSGELERRRRRQLRLRVENILKERILNTADELIGVERAVGEALKNRLDPYRVADSIFRDVVQGEGNDPSAADREGG